MTLNRLTFFLLLLFFSGNPACLYSQDTCKVQINLDLVKDDRVKVIVTPPSLNSETVEYVMPTVIPGSYYKKDFGRFVVNFKAYSKKGKSLKVKKSGNNVFVIQKAKSLGRIEYWIDDTWDAPEENFVFQPGGTNIQQKRNFVINHNGFYGYFEEKKNCAYELTIQKPDDFYGLTAFPVRSNQKTDVFRSSSYKVLVDNPVMYSVPDTTTFYSGKTKIDLGVYSDNNMVRSVFLKKTIQDLAKSLDDFFGKLPVDHYTFIFYFSKHAKEGVSRYGGFGALEHPYSSFYFLPEIADKTELLDMVLSLTSHEFLHILTPLNIHSEEIEFFDFRHPKMSQHLWMYEGITEYFSHLTLLKSKLINENKFIHEITGKITRAGEYASVSFTEMSKNILSDQYKAMYSNVYEKGALLAFLFDIELQSQSKGAMDLRKLMLLLAAKYGPSVPFKDDELIPEIIQLTFPSVKTFFDDYVIGKKELPYERYFRLIGWEYYHNENVPYLTFGKIYLYNDFQGNRVFCLGADSTANDFGLNSNDILLSINGKSVKPGNDDLLDMIEEPGLKSELEIRFDRNGKIITRKAKPHYDQELKVNYIRKVELSVWDKEHDLRKSVLGIELPWRPEEPRIDGK